MEKIKNKFLKENNLIKIFFTCLKLIKKKLPILNILKNKNLKMFLRNKLINLINQLIEFN